MSWEVTFLVIVWRTFSVQILLNMAERYNVLWRRACRNLWSAESVRWKLFCRNSSSGTEMMYDFEQKCWRKTNSEVLHLSLQSEKLWILVLLCFFNGPLQFQPLILSTSLYKGSLNQKYKSSVSLTWPLSTFFFTLNRLMCL